MKSIPISRGLFANIDDEDFALVQPYSWCATGGPKFYARAHRLGTKRNGGHILMHRLILGLLEAPRGVQVDHINGDTLDNRRENLRVATARQNCANREFKKSATGFRGVSYRYGNWRVRCGNGPDRHIGSYSTAHDAALAYDQAAKAKFGQFARLNFPETH